MYKKKIYKKIFLLYTMIFIFSGHLPLTPSVDTDSDDFYQQRKVPGSEDQKTNQNPNIFTHSSAEIFSSL